MFRNRRRLAVIALALAGVGTAVAADLASTTSNDQARWLHTSASAERDGGWQR